MRELAGWMVLGLLAGPADVSHVQTCMALARLDPSFAGRRITFESRLGVDVRQNGNYIRACGRPVQHRIAPGSQADRAWQGLQNGMANSPDNKDHEVYIDIHGIRAQVSGTVACGRLGRHCWLRVDQIRDIQKPSL